MHKEALCAEVARRTGLRNEQVMPVIDHMVRAIAQALAKGDYVMIKGFGRFHLRDVPPQRLNGIHGQVLDLPARRRPAWNPHQELLQFLRAKGALTQ